MSIGGWCRVLAVSCAALVVAPSGALGASLYAGDGDALKGFETNAPGPGLAAAASSTAVTAPGDLAFAPDAETAFAISGAGIVPIAPARGVAGPVVPVDASPQSHVAVAPDGRAALVTSPSTGKVTALDTATLTPGATFPVVGAAAVAIAPDGAAAYVTGSAASLTPIDLPSGTVGTAIALASPGSAISITPDGALALVAGGTATAGTVQVVDLVTGVAEPPIALGDRAATLVSVSRDGHFAAVADAGGSVWLVDIAARHASRLLGADEAPRPGITFTADGLLVVASQGCPHPPHCSAGYTVAYDLSGDVVHRFDTYLPGALRPAPEPTATFVGLWARPGEPKQLDAGASSNTGGTVTSYTWDFGDGSPTVTTTGPTTTHTYTAVGTYTARLTTTNAGGCATSTVYTGQSLLCSGRTSATTTRSIAVATPPPPAVYPPPVAHTFPAAGVTATGATLTGSVDYPASARRWRFEYGSTTRYGQRTPELHTQDLINIAPARQSVTGLVPNHRYHYRLVVTDAGGAVLSTGADATFVTRTSGSLPLRSTVIHVAGRSAAVPVRCSSIRACRGSVALVARVPIGARHRLTSVTCGTGRFSLAAGRSGSVRVPVGTRCAALLRRHGSVAGQSRTQLTSGQRAATRAVRLRLTR
jgi:hypothetical protein